MFNLLCAESPECSRIDQKISLFFGLFGRKRTIDQNSLVYFGQSRALPFATSDSTATQHRPKTTPIRHCRDSLATVSHRCCTGNIKTSPVSPVRQWRTKKPRLHNSFTASEALSAKRGNDTRPYTHLAYFPAAFNAALGPATSR